jgi:hypothetical protein
MGKSTIHGSFSIATLNYQRGCDLGHLQRWTKLLGAHVLCIDVSKFGVITRLQWLAGSHQSPIYQVNCWRVFTNGSPNCGPLLHYAIGTLDFNEFLSLLLVYRQTDGFSHKESLNWPISCFCSRESNMGAESQVMKWEHWRFHTSVCMCYCVFHNVWYSSIVVSSD